MKTPQILSMLPFSSEEYTKKVEDLFDAFVASDLNYEELKKIWIYDLRVIQTGYGNWCWKLEIHFDFDFELEKIGYGWLSNDASLYDFYKSVEFQSETYDQLIYDIAYEIIKRNISEIKEHVKISVDFNRLSEDI